MGVAATLDAQGEIILAGGVRYFAKHLPPVLTDRERLSAAFMRHLQRQRRSDSANNATSGTVPTASAQGGTPSDAAEQSTVEAKVGIEYIA